MDDGKASANPGGVNPLIVASDVLSRAFFHPLTFLGDYVGRFAQDFAKHQTFWSIFNNLLSLLILVVLGGVIFMFLFKVGIFLWVNYHGGQRVPPTHRSRVEDVPDQELGHVTEGPKRRDEHLVLDRDRTKLDPHCDDRPVPDQGRVKPDSRDRSIPDRDPDSGEEGRRFKDAKTDEPTAIDDSGDARPDDTLFSEVEQT